MLTVPLDCEAILKAVPSSASGVYTIVPDDKPMEVYCDMSFQGGGWTVFQRRVDASQDFYLNWAEYKKGFGDKKANFWLGNENLNRLTSSGQYNVLISMTLRSNGTQWHAYYDNFGVGDESTFYKVSFSTPLKQQCSTARDNGGEFSFFVGDTKK